MEYITRDEYSKSQARMHEKVNDIDKSVVRQEVTVTKIEGYVKDIHKVIYGNGKDGMAVKISNALHDIKVHFRLIMLIISGLLATAFFLIR